MDNHLRNRSTEMSSPRYDELGQRVTDCCGAYSTYVEATLCCKRCYQEVPTGQGDGYEFKKGITEDEYFANLDARRETP